MRLNIYRLITKTWTRIKLLLFVCVPSVHTCVKTTCKNFTAPKKKIKHADVWTFVCVQVVLGFDSSTTDAVEQWSDSITHPEKVVTAWHRLSHS